MGHSTVCFQGGGSAIAKRNQVEKDQKRHKEKQSYSKNMPRDCDFRLKCLNIQGDHRKK